MTRSRYKQSWQSNRLEWHIAYCTLFLPRGGIHSTATGVHVFGDSCRSQVDEFYLVDRFGSQPGRVAGSVLCRSHPRPSRAHHLSSLRPLALSNTNAVGYQWPHEGEKSMDDPLPLCRVPSFCVAAAGDRGDEQAGRFGPGAAAVWAAGSQDRTAAPFRRGQRAHHPDSQPKDERGQE